MKYSFSTSLISYVSARVERTVFMLQLVVIQSFFKYLNRALVPTSQRQRVHVSDILNIIYLPCTQSQKQGTHENIILNCSYIRLCQGVSGACYCDRQLGFAPEADQCENCWSISQQALPNGCQPCTTTEVFSPSSKTRKRPHFQLCNQLQLIKPQQRPLQKQIMQVHLLYVVQTMRLQLSLVSIKKSKLIFSRKIVKFGRVLLQKIELIQQMNTEVVSIQQIFEHQIFSDFGLFQLKIVIFCFYNSSKKLS
ncbi:Hypothetical_protein [Hexamita inflata]|uniref:Hypothetical_protein n=1 Tax=Hexamita inflata TaxID=28002 RepID=A0AA86NM64_9EUKA|nr:Hypothetical protein HINF_LOCUS10467 [Hexamita inflata]